MTSYHLIPVVFNRDIFILANKLFTSTTISVICNSCNNGTRDLPEA